MSTAREFELNIEGLNQWQRDQQVIVKALSGKYEPVGSVAQRARMPVLRVNRVLLAFGSASPFVEKCIRERNGKIITLWRKQSVKKPAPTTSFQKARAARA